MSTTPTPTTKTLRARASHPAASNVDYWAFRCRPDAERADRDAADDAKADR